MRYLKTTIAAAATLTAVAGLSTAGIIDQTPLEARVVNAATETISGTISAVRADKNEFDLSMEVDARGETKIVTVSVNEGTIFTLNGEASTMEEALKKDREALVTHEDSMALRVDVSTVE